MRLLVQRVRSAKVETRGRELSRIAVGLVVLAGFGRGDESLPGTAVWDKMLDKLVHMRVFPDPEDRMNLSLKEWGGELLLVSQFTLYADLAKGRRPSFTPAAEPEAALALYERLAADLAALMPDKVRLGEFGANMNVSLVNWGPVTMLLDHETI